MLKRTAQGGVVSHRAMRRPATCSYLVFRESLRLNSAIAARLPGDEHHVQPLLVFVMDRLRWRTEHGPLPGRATQGSILQN